MEHLNWAIVGPGNIAESFIEDMPLVQSCKNTVIGVMSDKEEEAFSFAQKYGIPHWFHSLPAMLKKIHPDIVYISSPHTAHFQEAMTCIEHGCAVLCEKPMTINASQAKILTDTAKQKKIFLMEGMWIRFLPSILKVLTLLKEGTIGRTNCIVADMSYVAPRNPHSRFYNPELGGGSLLDLGIYPVYLSLLVLGIPDKIKVSAKLSNKKIDEHCTAVFEYSEREQLAQLTSSIINQTECSTTIYGSKGKITILPQWNEKPKRIDIVLHNGKTCHYPCEWEGRGFQFEIEEVVHCLKEGKTESSFHSHFDSLQLMQTLDRIRAKAGIIYPDEK